MGGRVPLSALLLVGLLGCASPGPAPPGPRPSSTYASTELAQVGTPPGHVSAPRVIPSPAPKPTPPSAASARVLVVINDSSPESREIGEYYVRMRSIPRANVVRVNVSRSENISFDEYKNGIEAKVRAAIRGKPRIDYIVLTKGVPIRLRDNNGYSVDGHLVAMERDFEPISTVEQPVREAVERSVNPFFLSTERFDSRRFQMYLVTRLDGYTVADAKRLVDNALAAKPHRGPFFFDLADNRSASGYGDMQETLVRAHQILLRKGFDARLEAGRPFVAPPEPLAGYASWGSNDAAYDRTIYRRLRFLPGAIAETFVSTSGRTFSPTTGGQSLIADLIEQGVTGVKGYVSEPFTIALARADVLFDRYTAGFNLAESFYAASPLIKWKDVVVGDPLVNPYGENP